MPFDPVCLAVPCVEVSVSSLAAPGAQDKRSFIVLPANPNVSPGDLEFTEFASQLQRAMVLKGFTPAEGRDPEIVVFLDYAFGSRQALTSQPVYGWSRGPTSTVTGTAITTGSMTTVHGTVNNMPTYGVTGSQTVTTTENTRAVRITAFDAQSVTKGQTPRELWRTTAASVGTSDDARIVFSIMLSSADDWFGRATPRNQFNRIGFGNRDARTIRGER